MGINKDYANLTAQKRNAEAKYRATENRIDDYSNRIKRLKKTKNVLTDLKKSFRSLKNQDEKLFDRDQRDWQGQSFRDFRTAGNDVSMENERFYRNSLDSTLDAINNEITILENQKLKEYGLLGELGAMINNLANELRNCLN